MTLTDIHAMNAAMPAFIFTSEANRALEIEALPALVEARDRDTLCKIVRAGDGTLRFYSLASDGVLPPCYVITDAEPHATMASALARMAQFWRDEYSGAM